VADNALTAAVRENAGKGVARKLRATGRIPGVFYGNAREPLAISLDPQELEHLLAESDAGMNTLIDLTVKGNGDGGTTLVLVKDIQRDPIRGIALHADLLAIDVSKTITATIPIRVEGTASGVSVSDGILDQALRELDLECMPTSIPKEIVADVTQLEVGDSLHIRDLPLPAGVKLLSDPDLSVLSVVAPAAEEEEVVDEEAVEEGAELEEGEGDAPAEEGKSDDAPKEDASNS